MVSGEDKRIVLGGSDIFVLPSLSENFGIAVVEATVCGMPVIISNRPGRGTISTRRRRLSWGTNGR